MRRPAGPREEYAIFFVYDFFHGQVVRPPVLVEGRAIRTPNQIRVLMQTTGLNGAPPAKWMLGALESQPARSPAEAWQRFILYATKVVDERAARLSEAAARLREAIELSQAWLPRQNILPEPLAPPGRIG